MIAVRAEGRINVGDVLFFNHTNCFPQANQSVNNAAFMKE